MSGYQELQARPDRGCADVPQDAFFVHGSKRSLVRRAQAICAGCPVLAECAAWAEPQVRHRLLTDCVVAGVLLPTVDGSKQRREAAADQLAEIAAGGRVWVRGAA